MIRVALTYSRRKRRIKEVLCMKFSIDRDSFAKLLKKVDGVCAKTGNFTILANCLIEAFDNQITVTGTDNSFTLRVFSAANITEEGKVVVSSKLLSDTLQGLSSGTDVLLYTNGNQLQIECGHFKSRILLADDKEYPPIPSLTASSAVTINGLVLKNLIDKIAFSISKDETRPDFTGAFLTIAPNGIIQLVSTDGHRLSRVESDVTLNGKFASNFEEGIIVMGKSLNEISKLLTDESIRMDFIKDKFILQADSFVVYSNIIAGRFPDFSKVIPENPPHKAIIRREDFVNLIRRAMTYTSKTSVVRLDLTHGKLAISSYNQNGEEMSDLVECEYDGSGVASGFNYNYISQILSNIGCDVVSLEIVDPDSPAVIRDVATDRLDYIIMPMQL